MSLPLKEHRVLTSPQGDSDAFDTSESTGKDILEFDIEDEVLALKTHLVNNANDELGWTPFHWKLFFLNGFGYAVDSLLTMVQGVTGAQAFRELATASSYVNAGVVAQNVGLLVGALFWGFGADILGRRLAFNLTLWITSVAMVVAGAAPNFPFLGAFLALSTFGSGGNLILDPTVLLEFLPGDKQWVVTALAGWWGFGQSITGFVAWGFMTQSRWNCSDSNDCGWSNNAGWRYTMFTCGALVFVLSILRVTVVRLVETPKYLLTAGLDADVVKYYQDQARKYNKPCSLTLEKLESCGQVRLTQSEGKTFILSDITGHVEGLFVSRKITLSTILIWLSWAITGLAYPLFYVFLPAYLSTRVPGKPVSQFETYRNLTLTTISGIPGPLVAGYLVSTRLGRKYTMFIGALASMALFFGITGIKTDAQNWFQDAKLLTDHALEALYLAMGLKKPEEIKVKISKQEAQELVLVFFNIKPGDDTTDVENVINEVDLFLVEVGRPGQDPWPENVKPRIFCNSGWLEKKQWDSIILDKDGNEDEARTTVKDHFLKQYTEKRLDRLTPFWAPEFGEYLLDEQSTNYCSRQGAAATTQDQMSVQAVTLCARSTRWKASEPQTLAEVAAVTEEGESIAKRQSHSLHLFHEAFHVALGNEETPDHTYALKVMLADKDHPSRIIGGNSVEKRGYLQAKEAAHNPESWTFFALAVHLTHENPGFSFTSTISKKRES